MASVASVPAYMLPGAQVVQQPRSNLDTGDPSLATEILPGPPSLFSVQQAAVKRDPRKPTPLLTYLPQHDPGTTYSGISTGPLVGSLEANPEVDGPRRKRARVDKGPASQRNQRASARNLNGLGMLGDNGVAHDAALLAAGHSDPALTVQESDDADGSRSNSVSNLDDPGASSVTSRPHRKDKGKGKGREKATVRVKEEPPQVALQMGDLTSVAVNSPPVEFQLPEDIRTFFKHVGSSSRGTYLDTSTLKPPRLKWVLACLSEIILYLASLFARSSRHGQLEDRDPYRTKDRNGSPVLCFRCGGSALPEGVNNATSVAKRPRRSSVQLQADEHWRAVVSCDYCNLHWHLDCLDPPLLVMPPFDKKWMCPNHAEHTLRPKARIPKQSSIPIDVTKPGQANNGMIEVIAPDNVPSAQDKVVVDEVFINGRRYRVPERIIKLDFWNKVHKDVASSSYSNDISRMSSPLTSLSSLDEHNDDMKPSPEFDLAALDVQDVRIALMLMDISRNSQAESSASSARTMVDDGVQAPSGRSTPLTSAAARRRAASPAAQIETSDAAQAANNITTEKSSKLRHTKPPPELSLGPMNTSLDPERKPPAPERKQPARASKKDVSYIIPSLDVDADESGRVSSMENNASASGEPSSDIPKAKKPGRPRNNARNHRHSLTLDNTTPGKLTHTAALSRLPVTFSPSTPLASHKSSGDSTGGPNAPSTQSSTLKIRLPPRSSMASGSILPVSAISSPSNVKSRTGGKRRSLRRQSSVAASSSTSVSKLDGSKGATPT
ncbi:hypothetical protein EVG20_g9263 [Dentipellis fragilis]|uniref:Zinc finger PHD-type domain-containing protein n=1 Tax=Dentipellis fragilis TaxID=205917 RepID=A0A4Y9Y1Z5_9AGAM|nr:hypothetical protein EVG20_g9263 [Dentipellis fragilis]